ncbi:MAG: hypothetical protein GY864_05240 [Desulfobacterales bacterium]|nr:hypothetical protein [Desulfobacterales bacterium]
MILSFHPCFDADVQIILGSRSLNEDDLDLVQQANAVILPQGRMEEIYNACLRSGAQMFPNYEMRFKYPGKIGQSILFQDFGCTHPETLPWSNVKKFKQAFPDDMEAFPHELPFLIKDDKSHEAEGVFFVKNKVSLSEALDSMILREKSGLPGFVSQAYVPSDADVLRAVIIGHRTITYWKRPTKSGQVITTISRGARIDHHWRPDLREKGKARVHALTKKTGINLAAIDFLFPVSEKDPEPVFLEINYYFGRRGLGGSENYYKLLYQAVRDWLEERGMDPDAVKLV